MPLLKPHTLPASALLLVLYGSSAGAWAQTAPAPDAGRVLQELQPAPVLTTPKAAPLQRMESTSDTSANDGATVLVKAIRIEGNQVIASEELQALVASLIGSEQSLAQLSRAARRITAHYRKRGFAVARAYLPAQDITSGTVTIRVVEGRISGQRLSNQSRLSDDRAQAYVGQVKEGEVIRSGQIDRGLLLLQDTPGVGNSRATLQPGASVGTSELLIELDPARAYNGTAMLDNYGNRYTGEYRLGGNFNLVSPLHIGDQLSFSALSSGPRLSFGRLAYQLPVGSDGLRVGAAYFDTRYKLGQEFAALAAHGTATSASVFAAYPFVRSQLANLSGTVALENKRLNDYVDATATATARTTGVTSLGLAGNLQDAFGGGGINSFDLSLILGRLDIQSPTARAIDAASAQTNGSYSRLAYGASRLQRLGNSTLLWMSLTGQWAGKNLDSSEKFSLGGISGVRAYPQGEASGDEGQRATLELRQALGENLQGTVFYDFGSIRTSKTPFAAGANSRKLAGAGVGLNASFKKLQLRSALAWRTDGGLPTSIPAAHAKNPTLWLQASLAF